MCSLGPQLTQLMEQLRTEMAENPPLTGAYKPKKGDICAAKFSIDNEWYRGRVEKITSNGASIFYIDYGNVSRQSQERQGCSNKGAKAMRIELWHFANTLLFNQNFLVYAKYCCLICLLDAVPCGLYI